MAADNGGSNSGGRVTTKQFYEALLDQNRQRSEMEKRLLEKLQPLEYVCKKVEDNKQNIHEINNDIKSLERRYNWWSGLNSLLGAAIGAVLAALQGK